MTKALKKLISDLKFKQKEFRKFSVPEEDIFHDVTDVLVRHCPRSTKLDDFGEAIYSLGYYVALRFEPHDPVAKRKIKKPTIKGGKNEKEKKSKETKKSNC